MTAACPSAGFICETASCQTTVVHRVHASWRNRDNVALDMLEAVFVRPCGHKYGDPRSSGPSRFSSYRHECRGNDPCDYSKSIRAWPIS